MLYHPLGKSKEAFSVARNSQILNQAGAIRVPMHAQQSARMLLKEAGLGKKIVTIPDINCSSETFQKILLESFPKLSDAGGFEFLRCIHNTRDLEPGFQGVLHS